MKVKIGNKIIDSNDQPIMIIFDEGEKELIGSMEGQAMKYCSFPESSKIPDIEEFMITDQGDTNQLCMSIDNDVAIVNTFQMRD
jgi:hypothetical protein